jgi:hypothetical protein
MKLYFYILDRTYEGDFSLRCEECEVIEKPKGYRAATGFPKGIYIRYMKKENIGKISDSLTPYIVLEKPNYQFVKETFLKKCNNEIRRFKNVIAMYENKIAAIEDYKEDTEC